MLHYVILSISQAAVPFSVIRICVAVCCSVLQYVAVCCSMLQYVVVGCGGLQCVVSAISVVHRVFPNSLFFCLDHLLS